MTIFWSAMMYWWSRRKNSRATRAWRINSSRRWVPRHSPSRLSQAEAGGGSPLRSARSPGSGDSSGSRAPAPSDSTMSRAARTARSSRAFFRGAEMIRGVTASSMRMLSASSTMQVSMPRMTTAAHSVPPAGRTISSRNRRRSRVGQTAQGQAVAQKIGQELLARHVGDVRLIAPPPVGNRSHRPGDPAGAHAAEAVQGLHPLRIPLHQIVVDRDHMAGPAPPPGQSGGKPRRQGLSLPCRHFRPGTR